VSACGHGARERCQLIKRFIDSNRRRTQFVWAVSELGDSEKMHTLLGEAFAERGSLLVLPRIPCLRRLRSEPVMEELSRRLRGAAAAGVPR
jgi:hypothetical protein